MREHLLEDDWVAEDPEHHLLPHVERLCADQGWELAWEVVDHVLELDVTLPADEWWRTTRVASFAVAGVISEKLTVVIDERMNQDEVVRLTIVTGMREGDGVFAPHGHVVRVRVRLAAG